MPNCDYCDAPATHHGEGEYVCERHIYPAARGEYKKLPVVDRKQVFTDRLTERLRANLGNDVRVDVSDWAGCDEDWARPIYVTAESYKDDFVQSLSDAVLDLEAPEVTINEQVMFAFDQLLEG